MAPNGWNIKTLGNYCEFSQGFQVGVDAQMDSFAEGLVRFVRIVDYTKAFEPPRYVRKLENYYLVAKDDLVMVRYGVAGLICRGIEGVIANNLFRIKPKEQDSDKAYLYTWFEHHQIQISRLAASSTMPALKFSDLKSLNIVLPPIAEQRKIAKILSTWDKAISTTERLIDNSKQQKKALMQQLLTGKKRLLDDSGKPFEGEWEEVKLSHFFERVMEKNNGQSKNVVTISAQHGLIRQEEFFKKSVASETLDNYFILRKGQFAYNKSYSNGYPVGAIKRLNRYDDAVVTSLYICFQLKDEQLASSCFMEQFFESGLLNRGLKKVAAEGGRAHGLLNVKPADFMSLPMAVPKINEQQKIASVLTNADKEIELSEQQLANLKQEKKALMQQLLTGKRRVKIDDKEVA